MRRKKAPKKARRNYKQEFDQLAAEMLSLRNEANVYREALEFIAGGFVHGDDSTVVYRLRDLATQVIRTLRYPSSVDRLLGMVQKAHDRLGNRVITAEEFIKEIEEKRKP